MCIAFRIAAVYAHLSQTQRFLWNGRKNVQLIATSDYSRRALEETASDASVLMNGYLYLLCVRKRRISEGADAKL